MQLPVKLLRTLPNERRNTAANHVGTNLSSDALTNILIGVIQIFMKLACHWCAVVNNVHCYVQRRPVALIKSHDRGLPGLAESGIAASSPVTETLHCWLQWSV